MVNEEGNGVKSIGCLKRDVEVKVEVEVGMDLVEIFFNRSVRNKF